MTTQGEWRYLFLGAGRVIVFNLAGTLHAIDDDCPNHGASLVAGKRNGAMVRCPAHALCFDLASSEQRGGGLCLTRHAIEMSEDGVPARISEA